MGFYFFYFYYFLGFILLFCGNSVTNVYGSIHEYKNEAFIAQSNAFLFHGGSEGLYASKVVDSSSSSSSSDKPLKVKGKSFIRYILILIFMILFEMNLFAIFFRFD